MHPRSVLFLVAVAILGAVTTSGAADHRIDMSGSAFVPNTIQIVTGDSVAWFNEDGVDHTVTSGVSCSPDGLFDSGTLHAGSARAGSKSPRLPSRKRKVFRTLR